MRNLEAGLLALLGIMLGVLGGCSSAPEWDQRNADFHAGRGQYASPGR